MRVRIPMPAGLSPFSRPCLTSAVEKHLTVAITAGHFSNGLPSERDLAHWYDVSRPTIRRALANLRTRGVVSTRARSRSRTSLQSLAA